MREEYEGPMPTANATLALVFLRLFGYTGEGAFRDRAEKTINSFKEQFDQVPSAQPTMLMAVDWLKGPAREIVVAGPGAEALLGKIRSLFLPNTVVARAEGGAKLPLVEGKGAVGGKAAAYVCENMACKAPVTEVDALEEALRK
jgi:uncharacterized protein YyaL (SSP411 family)